jgi:hypothetical protein
MESMKLFRLARFTVTLNVIHISTNERPAIDLCSGCACGTTPRKARIIDDCVVRFAVQFDRMATWCVVGGTISIVVSDRRMRARSIPRTTRVLVQLEPRDWAMIWKK